MIKNDCNMTLPQMVYNNRNKILDIQKTLDAREIKEMSIFISKDTWSSYEGVFLAKKVVISIPYSEQGYCIISPKTGEGNNAQILENYAKINELRYIGEPGVSANNWLLVCYNGAPTIDLTLNVVYARNKKIQCTEEA